MASVPQDSFIEHSPVISIEVPQETRDCLHDDDIWDSYLAALDLVLTGKRNKQQKQVNTSKVHEWLFSRSTVAGKQPQSLLEASFTTRPEFEEQLKKDRGNFQNQTGFSNKEYEYAMSTLYYMGDRCASGSVPGALVVAWNKLREAGMKPRENCISTYMYTLGLETATNCQNAIEDTRMEVAIFHDLLFEPNEKTVYLRIKALVEKGNAAGAEQVLASLADNGKEAESKRLRTFMPLLEYYCSMEDTSAVLRLYSNMRDAPGAYLDSDTYAMILGCLARNRCFQNDAEPIEGATDAGFSASSGSALFDEIAHDMANDILEMTETSAQELYRNFCKGFDAQDAVQVSDLNELQAATEARMEGLEIGRVQVNETSAICPLTGARLRLFVLDETQRLHVHNTLLQMADEKYKEYIERLDSNVMKNHVAKQKDFAFQELSRFCQWLKDREGEPFTAFVDGPNVAYFGHNHLHYSQVECVVDELERMGERPLVVMPKKYTTPKFHLSSGSIQVLSEREIRVRDSLIASGKMYIVPAFCLDDYYWMVASVSDQNSTKYQDDFHVPVDNDGGRFPGLRPMLITNDQTRDHKLQLLEARPFRRWRSCYIVRYSFLDYQEDEWEKRQVEMIPADFYSREIQCNAVEKGGVAWHIPITEWDEHDFLCIRLS